MGWFRTRQQSIFCLLVILSLVLVLLVVSEHREITATTAAMDQFLESEEKTLVSQPAVAAVTAATTTTATATTTAWSHDYSRYDWNRSTEENYHPPSMQSTGRVVGEFKEFRERLDRSYHKDYLPERQALQDTILRSFLTETANTDTGDESHESTMLFATKTGNGNSDKSCEKEPTTTDDPSRNHQNGQDSTTGNASFAVVSSSPQWIVFTAGVYGAGKTHVIEQLQETGCFPQVSSFVGVDPDQIRRRLPEFSLYDPQKAGVLTQKEAGMVAELLTEIALSSGRNVLVDGSLRNATWYEGYFRHLRSLNFGSGCFHHSNNLKEQQQGYQRDNSSSTSTSSATTQPPKINNDVYEHQSREISETIHNNSSSNNNNKTINLRIGILYVTAPADEIYERVEQRGATTGRAVPLELLERSMGEVPRAVERLEPLADFFLHVHNSQKKTTDKNIQHREGKRDRNYHPREDRQGQGHLSISEIEASIFQEKCQSITGY